MDCDPPGSSLHGISQTRILGWVAISFSRGSSSKSETERTMVVVKDWGRWRGVDGECSIDVEFQIYKMKRVLGMNGGDGCRAMYLYH